MVDSGLIYSGSILRVRWMRFKGSYPAKAFLSGYREDFQAFLARAEEMGDFGRIAIDKKGHFLKGDYREIYEFKMPITRAFGFRDGNLFIVTNAARKTDTTKAQIPDYDRALKLKADYLARNHSDE